MSFVRSFVRSFVPVLIARLFLRANVAVINGRVSLLRGSRAGDLGQQVSQRVSPCGSSNFRAQSSISHKAVT